MDTDQIIAGCRRGEQAAIEALVRDYEKSLYRLALSILDDPAEAEETTQDAFLAALKAIQGYRGEAALNTWLYRITANLCRTRLRRRKARERLKQALQVIFRLGGQDRAHHPESAALQSEANAAVWRAIRALDEKHRLVVIFYFYHDLPVVEIARILSLPEGTVYSRLETAFGRLRGLLERAETRLAPQDSALSRVGPDTGLAFPEEAVNADRKLPDG